MGGTMITIDPIKKAEIDLANIKPITPRQARLALNHFDLRDSVEAAILNADQNTKDEWEFANEIRRDWPALTQLAFAIGITESQLDELFIYGATL
jgi:hypothetical protein